MQKIFSAAEVPISWDVQEIGKEVDPRTNSFVTRENLDSVLVRTARRGRAGAASAAASEKGSPRGERVCLSRRHARYGWH